LILALLLTQTGGGMGITQNENAMKPCGLRCEYQTNPLGLTERAPRLSWVFQHEENPKRGKLQTAYQILAASSEANCAPGKADLWDTGKVATDRNIQIPFGGKSLESHKQCWWKVRVWDEKGNESAWSEPAFFSMGLLEKEDWKAEWIGYDAGRDASHGHGFDRLEWIWFPEGNPQKHAPQGTRYFRASFSLPEKAAIAKAGIFITVDDSFTLYVNGKKAGSGQEWNEYYSFDLASFLNPGKNILAVEAVNREPSPAGLIAKMVVEFESGDPLILASDDKWKTSDQELEGWSSPEFDDTGWKSAMKIATFPSQPWGNLVANQLYLPPAAYLRLSFVCGKKVKRALVHATALGIYELHINGRRVGEDYLTPGWTDYNKRVYYNTYDVTDVLRRGENAIAAILADGWYAGYFGFHKRRNHYGVNPRFFLQMYVEYADGTEDIITTNKSWKASREAIREADLLMGESYDARLEKTGWDDAGYNDSGWDQVTSGVAENFSPILEAYPGNPVRLIEEIPARTVSEPKPGIFVFDLGQNMVGVARLKIKGKPGRPIIVRHAERLNPDGTIYTLNLRSARSTDSYYPKSETEETWAPRFTFHGFQYVELSGCEGRPALDAVTGLVFHSDTPRSGNFECSDPLANQIFHNLLWGQKGNYLEVPTDCPQRDERLGWTGDGQVFIRTGSYNMDIAAFFTKWLVDLEDGQMENGTFPDVAPRLDLGGGSPAWADAGIICPYTIYTVYGDKRILERHYSSMTRYMNFLEARAKEFIQPDTGYGDWLSVNANTPRDVLATAYYAHVAELMSKIAGILGKSDDPEKYRLLFQNIRGAFNKAYVNEEGKIHGETQTNYLLALDMDLLPEEKRGAALGYLVSDIESRGFHLSSGFVGTRHALPILSRLGHNDLAYKLLLTDTFPSWGYPIRNGATTIWERWDGWTQERGFQDPGMNSFNHYAFGSVGEWLYGYVLGIDAEEPGYKKIIIRPQPSEKLSYAKGYYDSIHGRIASEWKIEKAGFYLTIEIPKNTTATVYIPAKDASTVTEGGKPVTSAEGVSLVRKEKDCLVLQVGSGRYSFISRDFK